MGETRVKVGILNLTDARLKAVEVECIVDTGATLTVIPRDILIQAKITPDGKIQLHLADGREISRDY
ncbi:MAG: aspartyl protease family protein, partial [Planctomycetota bacterium]|nr:aspartyl protease family protein [Planctomycetota bacterium]